MTIRAGAAILIAVALLSVPGTNVAHTGVQRVPRVAEHGCVLYTSVPNPCDPDSNN